MCKKFLDIKKEFDLNTVIETGTYHGTTTRWFSENFDVVHTVEVKPEHYEVALENIGKIPNIKMNLKDSPEFLEEILASVDDNKTILFLDAHWYTNPVLDELDSIKNSGKKPIIAIHDFMVPDHPEFGYDIYPEQYIIYNWDWIKGKVESIYGENGYTKEYNSIAEGAMRGCIFIYPKKY
jgi:hypothetical protein